MLPSIGPNVVNFVKENQKAGWLRATGSPKQIASPRAQPQTQKICGVESMKEIAVGENSRPASRNKLLTPSHPKTSLLAGAGPVVSLREKKAVSAGNEISNNQYN